MLLCRFFLFEAEERAVETVCVAGEFLGLLILEVILEAHVGAEPSRVSTVDIFPLIVHENIQFPLFFSLTFSHALLPLPLSLLLLFLFALLLLLGLAGLLLALQTLLLDTISLLLRSLLPLRPFLLRFFLPDPLLFLLFDHRCLFSLLLRLFRLLLLAKLFVGVPVERDLTFVVFCEVEIVLLSFPVEVDIECWFWQYESGFI